jgi:hypothetical protein
MANINPPLMKEIFNITKRQRKPNIEHHRKADHLWARFEVPKRRALDHTKTLATDPTLLKAV